jgi:hypothetical protein
MSKIALTPSASGTGVFTISSPATSTDRTLTLPDEAGTVLTTAGVPASAMPAGSVLQVVQSVYDTRDSTTSTSWVTIFNASITPTSSSSKILVMVSFSGSHTNNYSGLVRVLRNSTPIGGGFGPVASYEQNVWFNIRTSIDYYVATYAANHLDTPTTSSTITYNVQMQATGGVAFYINRTVSDSGTQTYDSPVASSITLMEIAG